MNNSPMLLFGDVIVSKDNVLSVNFVLNTCNKLSWNGLRCLEGFDEEILQGSIRNTTQSEFGESMVVDFIYVH